MIFVDEYSASEDLETPSSTSSGNTFGIQDSVNIVWPLCYYLELGFETLGSLSFIFSEFKS